MTTRLKRCVVSFDRDIREDDAEWILNAIRMVRGVASVEKAVSDTDDWIARQHVKQQIRAKIMAILEELR